MGAAKLDEEKFNMEVRKFLKKVGVTSQREIEHAVHEALDAGKVAAGKRLKAKMTLEIGELGTRVTIDGDISL